MAGEAFQVRVMVRDFSGEPVPLNEGFTLHILEGHEPLLVDTSFQPEDGGWYSVDYRAERGGVHTALLVHDGRELATAQVEVREKASDEPGLPSYLPWVALVLIAIVSVAVLVVATRI
ncbi:MAG: hypothetical protein GWN18_09865 [Thermoplasmata archaeon]|nr:hypothetical protein [Thermoplasmata archaeon]NIS12346.1 hypothetical protein [Thermoplasmata archaeon]NIS20266.1 hypothetical protein [Thermoplasmata archaeon]NIT77610.1 hypothetical protein [Thermoplasmata archaeon]NIU49357.1 hypothetical protein [Thermoplasmata archaeon]